MQPNYDEIRDHYSFLTPRIMDAQGKNISRWVSPYCNVRWELYFTPIEEFAWMALRSFGKAPFYPQYPVKNYFVDFGNPYVKIAIECDGKEFHKDKEKDRLRDENLFKEGWIVYRISGADCFRPVTDEYYDIYYQPEEEQYEILKEFYMGTIEGLINALAILHFEYAHFNQELNELDLAFECLKKRISVNNGTLEKNYEKMLFYHNTSDYDD